LAKLRDLARRFGPTITLVIAVVGSVGSGVAYLDSKIEHARRKIEDANKEQRELLFNVKKEFQKPFYQRQMDLCLEASNAASTLATSSDRKVAEEAYASFWRLYYGPLAAVEQSEQSTDTSPQVAGKMVDYGQMLKDSCKNRPCPSSEFEQASLQLAHECRRLFRQAWEDPLFVAPPASGRK